MSVGALRRRGYEIAFACAAILLGLMLVFSPQAYALGWYDNCYTEGDTSWYSDDQSAFTINTADELAGFAKLVTLDNVDFKGKTVLLGSDIDLSEVCGAGSGVSWLPIGHRIPTYGSFQGTFDGQGHDISNLYIDLNMSGVGLFGYVDGADVGDFTVSGEVTGTSNVGGVIAYCSNSDLHDIESSVDVEATANASNGNAGGVVGYSMTAYGKDCTYTSLVNKGRVKGTNYYTGGVIGFLGTSDTTVDVSKCANLGDVSVDHNGSGGGEANHAVGGVIGATTGDYGTFNITECFNSGSVSGGSLKSAGGIAGYLGGGSSSLAGCYNTGSVSGDNNAGGIAGYLGSQGGSLQCTYNTGSVSGGDAGGVVGSASNAGQTLGGNFSSADLAGAAADAYGPSVQADNSGTSLSVDQLRSKELLDILNAIGDFFDWDDPSATDEPANDGYPYLVWQNLKKGKPNGGAGTDPGDNPGGSSGEGGGSEGGSGGGEEDGSTDKPSGDSSGDKADDPSDPSDEDEDKKDDPADKPADDTDIDNSGGSDGDDQTGHGSGIKGEEIGDYDIPSGEDELPSKIDKDNLTHVNASVKRPKKAEEAKKPSESKKAKNPKKAKKPNKKNKDAKTAEKSSTQLVKVGMAPVSGSSVGGSNTAMGGPVNWLAIAVLLCIAAGATYELWRFRRLQPAKGIPQVKETDENMEVTE